jgi:hypothetical protein
MSITFGGKRVAGCGKTEPTIHVDHAVALTDQALGCLKHVPEADAETDILEDLIRVFVVDVVFNSLRTRLYKVRG